MLATIYFPSIYVFYNIYILTPNNKVVKGIMFLTNPCQSVSMNKHLTIGAPLHQS